MQAVDAVRNESPVLRLNGAVNVLAASYNRCFAAYSAARCNQVEDLPDATRTRCIGSGARCLLAPRHPQNDLPAMSLRGGRANCRPPQHLRLINLALRSFTDGKRHSEPGLHLLMTGSGFFQERRPGSKRLSVRTLMFFCCAERTLASVILQRKGKGVACAG